MSENLRQRIRYLSKSLDPRRFWVENITLNYLKSKKNEKIIKLNFIWVENNQQKIYLVDFFFNLNWPSNIFLFKIRPVFEKNIIKEEHSNSLIEIREKLKKAILDLGFKNEDNIPFKKVSLDLDLDEKKQAAYKALEKEAKEQKLAKEVLDFLDKDTKGITTKKKISKWKFTLNYVKNYNSAKYIFQIKKGKKIDFYYWKNIGDIKNYFSWYNKKIDKKTEKEINKFLLKESKGITSKKTPDLIEKEINWFNVYLYYNSSRYETLRYTLMITIPIKIGWEISNRIYKGEQIIDLINYKKS